MIWKKMMVVCLAFLFVIAGCGRESSQEGTATKTATAQGEAETARGETEFHPNLMLMKQVYSEYFDLLEAHKDNLEEGVRKGDAYADEAIERLMAIALKIDEEPDVFLEQFDEFMEYFEQYSFERGKRIGALYMNYLDEITEQIDRMSGN